MLHFLFVVTIALDFEDRMVIFVAAQAIEKMFGNRSN